MKGTSWWAMLAITCLTAAAATAPAPRHASARDRALAAYTARALSTASGQYAGAQYQAALRARARMLRNAQVQTRARPPGGAVTRAGTAPSVINWTEIGPGNVGGRINSIWIDPANAQHLIVGAAGGGLWQSSDGGGSWTAVAEFPGSLAVGAIAQLPNGTLLAGTGDEFNEFQPGDGLFLSTDGGNTWSPVVDTAPQSNTDFWSVILSIATSSSGVALASTWGGIARSTDGGQTWTQVWPSGGGVNASDQVVFDPNNPNSAAADNENGGVVYSTDAGATWNAATGLPGTAGARTALAFDPSVAGSVYALVDNNNGSSPSGEVFHSTDGGKTWTLLAGTSAFNNPVGGSAVGALCDNSFSGSPVECQGGYDNAILVEPHASGNPPTIVVGGIDIFTSTDGGSTWTMNGEAYGRSDHLHADQHAFAYSSATSTLYVGNDGGFYRQLPLGNWLQQNSGLADTQFYAISGHEGVTAAKNTAGGTAITPITAGAQDNGTLLYRGYSSGGAPLPDDWTPIFGGDGGQTHVDPVDGDYLYGEYTNLSLFYSDTGSTAQQYGTEPPDTAGQNANFIAPFALVPSAGASASQMIAGGASLWLGSNIQTANPTWTAVNGSGMPANTANSNYVSAIAIDPANSSDAWVGYNDGEVWHSTNALGGSPTWTQCGAGTLPSGRPVESFWIVPGRSNTVYVTYLGFKATGSDDNVWMTGDAGSSWTGIGTGLPPGPVYSLVTHPAYPQILYAGTLTGVYTSIDSGQSWYASSQGPANISVNRLSWFDTSTPSQPVLLAATDGRGAWMGSPAYNPTPVLTGVSPDQVTVGSPATVVMLDGSGFVAHSTATLDGAPISVSYQSATQLQATVPAATLATLGTHSFAVSNPIPGGGAAAAASLTVAYPAPAISGLSPSAAMMGDAGFTLTVAGSGFEPVSEVQWNGNALATTYVSASQLTASVPAGDLAGGGNATVTVSTPAPGGGTASATFAVDYPMPTLVSISPTSAQAGSGAATITASGGNFVPASTLDWNGMPLTTTFVSASQLTAGVPAGDLAQAGSASVTAVNPAPGGGRSTAVTFSVNAAPGSASGGGGGGALGWRALAALAMLAAVSWSRRRRTV